MKVNRKLKTKIKIIKSYYLKDETIFLKTMTPTMKNKKKKITNCYIKKSTDVATVYSKLLNRGTPLSLTTAPRLFTVS